MRLQNDLGRVALVSFSCFLLFACNNAKQFQTALVREANQCEDVARAAFPEDATDADIRKGIYPPKRGKLGDIVECVTEKERPVWIKYAPGFVDLFDAFRAKDAEYAEEYDKGKISHKKYKSEVRQAAVDFNNDVRDRRATINADNQQASQQTADAISSIGNSIAQIIQARSAR